MNILIRQEEERDFRESENLVREAFWNLYKPGCDEHLILNRMRRVPSYVKELALVACDEKKIVGNIYYTIAGILDESRRRREVLCMGPLAVLPSYQRMGVGSLLLDDSIERVRSLGYLAVVIFGNPDYYHRFGFRDAKNYGITTSQGENLDAFMVLEVQKGGLNGVKGRFYDDPVFKVLPEDVEDFDRGFPPKEKMITETQIW
jgi:predicted N-acetyltransferase YhbS